MTDKNEKNNLEYFNKNIHPRKADHPIIEFLFDHRLRFFKIYFKDDRKLLTLELGCGDGVSSYYLEKMFRIFGVDFAIEPLKLNLWVTKINANVKQLPFLDSTFDVVITSDLLHHISNPFDVLKEMKRVSRKYLMFMEPNPWNPIMALYCLIHPEERNIFKLSRKSLLSHLQKENLTLLGSCFCGLMTLQKFPISLLPIVKFLSRYPALENYIGFEYLVVAKKD